MMTAETKREIVEANRHRYEELQAAGQSATPKALPEPTKLGAAPMAPDAVIAQEEVPVGWYATVRLRRGEALRISDDSGLASVAMIGWCEDDTSERIIEPALRIAPVDRGWRQARVRVLRRVLYTRMRAFVVQSEDSRAAAEKLVSLTDRAVRHTPLTAMLDPTRRSSITVRPCTRMVRKSPAPLTAMISPTSSIIPVNIGC